MDSQTSKFLIFVLLKHVGVLLHERCLLCY